MRVVGLPKSFYHVGRLRIPEASPEVEERVRYLSCFIALREKGLSGIEASQALGIPRSTLYRWLRRAQKEGRSGLKDRSRRPKRCRRPTWSWELAQARLWWEASGAVPPLGQG